MLITVYSHHFTVRRFDINFKRSSYRFLADMQSYTTKFERGRGYIRKPEKLYAAASADRTVLRIHINSLKDYINHMIALGHSEREWEIVHAPSFIPADTNFVLNEKFEARDYQVPQISYLTEPGYQKVLTLQTGKGKCVPLDTKIKVPGGWIRMGDVKVGQTITAVHGGETTVTAVYPQPVKKVYRITFKDGRSTECSGEHLWRVFQANWVPRAQQTADTMGGKTDLGWRVITTDELIKEVSNPKKKGRLFIQLAESEQIPDVDLPMHPWVLGAMLGDGGLTGASMSFTSTHPFMIDKMLRLMPEGAILRPTTQSPHKDHGFRQASRDTPCVVKAMFKDMGLLGRGSADKFIPKEYLHASHNQRLELLQGLLDTDGQVGKPGNCGISGVPAKTGSISFSTTSLQLAKDVQYLVRSLGGMAAMANRQTYYTYKGEKLAGKPSYRVNIRMCKIKECLSVPHKRDRLTETNQYSDTLKIGITSIEYIGDKQTQCISVADESRLYVTDDFIVTHNTFCALSAMAEIQKRVVMIIPAKYIGKWIGDVQEAYGDSCKLLVIKGSSALRALLCAAAEGTLDVDYIIISATTLGNYYREYEKNDFTYDVTPEDFYPMLKAGVRLIDEAHENLHLNFKQDLYTHVAKGISLSATLEHDKPFITKILRIMFPREIRPESLEYDKYVNIYGLFYRANNPEKIKSSRNSMYSHAVFEDWIRADKERLANYLNLIRTVTDIKFMKARKDNMKLLIFAATVEMCKLIVDNLHERWPELAISTKVAGDEHEVLDNSDIIVSTLISTGTAVDIPDLYMCLMTTALSGLQKNLQAVGRLRKMKNFPGVTPVFYYLVCRDIAKHIEYHDKKKGIFSGKALRHEDLHSAFVV